MDTHLMDPTTHGTATSVESGALFELLVDGHGVLHHGLGFGFI